MALSELYQASILQHNRAPNHHARLADATHAAEGLDALCGDDIRIWLKLDGDRIARASWTGTACVITTASASMLTDWLFDRTTVELQAGYRRFSAMLEHPETEDDPCLGPFVALRPVSDFPSRVRNALLPWRTAITALDRPLT